MSSKDQLVGIAREHLPAGVVEQWTGLLKPAVRLAHATGDDAVAGHLGGDAELPPDMPWPAWEGYGPLSLWLSLDCAALPAGELALPDSGRLLFFLFDGQLCESTAPYIGDDGPESRGAHRVVYVPEGTPTSLREAPAELRHRVPAEPLTASVIWTAPQYPDDLDAWHARYGEPDEAASRALYDDGFDDELDLWGRAARQLGGHPFAPQSPVEEDLARYVVFAGAERSGPELRREIARWRLLLQFMPDYETGLWCGDTNYLYWFITADDLAARRFDRARLLRQDT
ncbi:YwqG family protein [Spirillospora sp. NPDC029432]|uniref:YwqG family protein n=1 Tax=Spirillospora sp. NPDC029432 TaxID=3154599 RepID=UPI003455F357